MAARVAATETTRSLYEKVGWLTESSLTYSSFTPSRRASRMTPGRILLLQAMPRFLEDFKVNLQFRFVLDLPESDISQPALLEKYALEDARRLAALHELMHAEAAAMMAQELGIPLRESAAPVAAGFHWSWMTPLAM